MFRTVLNNVPTGPLVVVVVTLTCGSVVLAVWLMRRWVPATREEFNSEIVAAMLGVLASTRVATGSRTHAAGCPRRSPR